MSRELALTEELSQILTKDEAPNDGLQLRRAISIQAAGLLPEKHAIALSAARLCSTAGAITVDRPHVLVWPQQEWTPYSAPRCISNRYIYRFFRSWCEP